VAGYAFGLTPMTVTAVFLFYMLLVLAAIDLDTMRLPNGLVMLLAAVGYFAALANQVTGVGLAPLATVDSGIFAAPLVAAAAGSLTAGGLSWGIAALYQGVRGRSGLGMGDVKLLLALGPYLGVYTILVLFVGSLIGAVAGIALARNRSQGLAAKIPFGPYLAIGAIVTALGGVPMVRWYMTLLGS
jgi:leader peptidase (prepilin peptidase)/N-methyltransferase